MGWTGFMKYGGIKFICLTVYLFSSTDIYTIYCEWCHVTGKVNKQGYWNKPGYEMPGIKSYRNSYIKPGYGYKLG